MRRALAGLAWALLLTWAAAAAFHPVGNFDIWVHLRVGLDVLRTGEVPRVDDYSWVGAGRPFLAHEWLSGVLFELVASPTNGDGLTVLRVWIVVLIGIACGFAVPRERRLSLTALAFTSATLLLVVARAAVRPHLFSLLLSVIVVVCLAWWRESRRPWPLLVLVPLTALWANLHGAFLLCPAALAITGVGVVLSSKFPRLSPGDRERPFTLSQAAQPFLAALACLAAALANPYGAALFGFSFEMGTGNDYIKRLILEWASPLHSDVRHLVDPWVFVAYLLLLVTGLFVERRRISLPEVLVVGAFTYLALDAIRFVADFALFALPLAVRTWGSTIERRSGERFSRREPWLMLLLALSLSGWTLWQGPSFRTRADFDFSWGFVRARAANMVKHLRAIDYDGGVYNEYEDGGYLVYAGKGRFKPVIDARIDIFGEDLVANWATARQHPDQMLLYLDRYRVDAVLLHQSREPFEEHKRALLASGHWRLELEQDGYLLLLRERR